jgi:hypothetical protein
MRHCTHHVLHSPAGPTFPRPVFHREERLGLLGTGRAGGAQPTRDWFLPDFCHGGNFEDRVSCSATLLVQRFKSYFLSETVEVSERKFSDGRRHWKLRGPSALQSQCSATVPRSCNAPARDARPSSMPVQVCGGGEGGGNRPRGPAHLAAASAAERRAPPHTARHGASEPHSRGSSHRTCTCCLQGPWQRAGPRQSSDPLLIRRGRSRQRGPGLTRDRTVITVRLRESHVVVRSSVVVREHVRI